MRLVIARAPTRIDFGGGWTDVPPYTTEQGGCVCNLAITLHASVSLHPSPAGVLIEEDGVIYESQSVEQIARYGRAEIVKAEL